MFCYVIDKGVQSATYSQRAVDDGHRTEYSGLIFLLAFHAIASSNPCYPHLNSLGLYSIATEILHHFRGHNTSIEVLLKIVSIATHENTT